MAVAYLQTTQNGSVAVHGSVQYGPRSVVTSTLWSSLNAGAWTTHTNTSSGGTSWVELEAMPSDLLTITEIRLNAQVSKVSINDDSAASFVQLYNQAETTALSNEMTAGNVAVGVINDGGDIIFTGLGSISADQILRLRLRTTYNTSMANDGGDLLWSFSTLDSVFGLKVTYEPSSNFMPHTQYNSNRKFTYKANSYYI